MSIPRQHHPYSPSKLQPIEASPAYESRDEETEASKAGTKQHAFMERETIDIDDSSLEDKEFNAVMQCRAYRDAILENHYPVPPIILKEQYLPIDDSPVVNPYKPNEKWTATTAGYTDFIFVSPDQTYADLFDWKFGLWSVEPAETNLQGIAYLLGLVFKYPTLKKVTVHFVMPHRNEIDRHTFTEDQFSMLRLRVKTVVARAMEARKSPNGEKCTARISSCLFCSRLGTCHTVADFVLKVGKKYDPVRVPNHVTPSILGDKAEANLLMEIATLMEAWAKATKRQMVDRALEDKDWVPELYKMMERSDTKVMDYSKFCAAALACGVPLEALDKLKQYPMTEVCKLISAAQPRGEKEAAIQSFRENLLASGAAVKEPPVYFLQRLKT